MELCAYTVNFECIKFRIIFVNQSIVWSIDCTCLNAIHCMNMWSKQMENFCYSLQSTTHERTSRLQISSTPKTENSCQITGTNKSNKRTAITAEISVRIVIGTNSWHPTTCTKFFVSPLSVSITIRHHISVRLTSTIAANVCGWFISTMALFRLSTHNTNWIIATLTTRSICMR